MDIETKLCSIAQLCTEEANAALKKAAWIDENVLFGFLCKKKVEELVLQTRYFAQQSIGVSAPKAFEYLVKAAESAAKATGYTEEGFVIDQSWLIMEKTFNEAFASSLASKAKLISSILDDIDIKEAELLWEKEKQRFIEMLEKS